MQVGYFVPLALLGGCISASYHSIKGTTPAPIADQAVVADSSDLAPLGANAQLIGTISTEAKATRGLEPASPADLTERAAQIAANEGGTHIELADSGTTTTTWVTPAQATRACEHTDQGRTCTRTYSPAQESSEDAPYATYDVYRVAPDHWKELPEALVPAPYVASHHAPSHPDGWGVTLGGFGGPTIGANSGTSGQVFPTTYEADSADLAGGWLSLSHVRGSTTYAIDLRLGGGAFAGTASSMQTASATYHGTYVGGALALRAGKRVAWQDFALAAGVGVAGAAWGGTAEADNGGFVEPGVSSSAELYAPLWAALTFKPTCSLGVQGVAEYDVDVLDTSASAPSFELGLVWQPASACSS